mmetsp:Transcript_21674/g.41385  ORF Transcript_21674/g.41385 Transcript_21674/m.41385 type:complete len:514 (+) Transcript_21674:385-1926(+)|eukprot:CAMPEP_0114241010 /NCGR_PEP_ID=MMETSP0058-20121206/9409_1 /TAXON_ID=36894 /ORGANISM="Pyramimonas parkeae, CCMP726" /LENGTH=513 /DNA_ID=CAMNT_0001353517 /DNA_START=309 /DNA_END=1850 /DNA_ORIENTATION=-
MKDGSLFQDIKDEVVEHVRLAIPVSLGMLSNRFIAAVSVAFVGRLGPQLLAPAALATTLSNVIGNSFIIGLTNASSTLAGQAFGAGHYEEVGLVLQRSLGIVAVCLAPITLLWLAMGRVLVLAGLDEYMAHKAGEYIIYLIPGLWAYGGKMAVQNFLHAQRITKPTAVAGIAAAFLHIPVNYIYMDWFRLGYTGAAMAYSFTQVLTLALLCAYLYVTGLRHSTWPGWSSTALTGWGPYLQLALPGVLLLSEWWASEINVFVAGYLPESDLEVATMAIYQTTVGLAFMIPVGIGMATNVRVSNNVGARYLAVAQRAALQGPCLCATATITQAAILMQSREQWASLFTSDEDLIRRVMMVCVIAAVYMVGDGITCALGGSLQGCGRQGQAVWIVLFAYYCVGLPLSFFFAFVLDWKILGLTAGMCIGTYVHCTIYGILVFTTNWENQALRAEILLRKSLSCSMIKLEDGDIEITDRSLMAATDDDMESEKFGLLNPSNLEYSSDSRQIIVTRTFE